MNVITDLLLQGIYINPQQIIVMILGFIVVFSVFIGMVIAFGKDRIDRNLD